MILICAKENFNLEDSLELSGLKLTSCPGELKIYIANSKILKDEIMIVIFFQNLPLHGGGQLGKIDGKIVLI